MVIANPIPAQYALDKTMIDQVIKDAVAEMKEKGISGKASTPFLLSKVAEKTAGSSLAANIELVFNNAKLASKIACEFCQ